MDRVYLSGAVPTKPEISSLTSKGYPTDGNPATGLPATVPGSAWAHMIMEELMAVVEAAGLSPSKDALTQLLDAIPKIVPSRLPSNSISSAKLEKTQDLNSHELQIRGMPLESLKKIVLKDRELAVATDTHALYIGDGKTTGGHLVGGDQQRQIDEIKAVLAALTKAVAVLGNQPKPFGGV